MAKKEASECCYSTVGAETDGVGQHMVEFVVGLDGERDAVWTKGVKEVSVRRKGKVRAPRDFDKTIGMGPLRRRVWASTEWKWKRVLC